MRVSLLLLVALSVPTALAQCTGQTSCLDCLTDESNGISTCAWIGECLESCNIADVACYSSLTLPDQTPSQICDLQATQSADDSACRDIDNCADCIATSLTVPPLDSPSTTTCRWVPGDNVCAADCGVALCFDQCFEDPTITCGSQMSCRDCAVTQPFGVGGGVSCLWYEQDSVCAYGCREEGCGRTTCPENVVDVDCSSQMTCLDCLAGGANMDDINTISVTTCGWAEIGQCLESCSDIADVLCYTAFDGIPAQTCDLEEGRREDVATCSGQITCADCLATSLTPPPGGFGLGVATTCQWYVESNSCSSRCEIQGCGIYDVECPAEDGGGLQSSTCSSQTNCLDCLTDNDSENDGISTCGWAAIGGCMESCDMISDVACYSASTFPGQTTPSQICDLEGAQNADSDTCTNINNCADCVATSLTVPPFDDSTATTCRWVPVENQCYGDCGPALCFDQCFDDPAITCGRQTSCSDCVFTTPFGIGAGGSCLWYEQDNTCAYGCREEGCGSTSCPEKVVDVDCSSQATCLDCLADGGNADDTSTITVTTCGWAEIGQCLESCKDLADVVCYTATSDGTPARTCDLEQARRDDAAACSSQTTCADCLGTNLTEPGGRGLGVPTTCQWYTESSTCVSSCGSQGCGIFDQECPAANGSGLQSACSQATSCTDCLESTSPTGTDGTTSCTWTAGQCMDSCMVADAACYTTGGGFAGQTPQQVCQVEQTNNANAAMCGSQTSCSDCVATMLSTADGTASTCQWFAEGSYCASGCGMAGCGATKCDDDDTSSAAGGYNHCHWAAVRAGNNFALFSLLLLLLMIGVSSIFGF